MSYILPCPSHPSHQRQLGEHNRNDNPADSLSVCLMPVSELSGVTAQKARVDYELNQPKDDEHPEIQ